MPRSKTPSFSPNPPGGSVGSRFRRVFLPLAVTAILLSPLGCEQPPRDNLEEVETALAGARRAGADAYAPEELRDAHEALGEARRAAAVQGARLRFQRDYREALTLADRAKFLATQTLRLTRLRRERAQREAEQGVEELRSELARAQEVKRYLMPKNREVVTLLVGAGVDLGVAERRLETEDFPGSGEAARRGTSRVREADRLLLSDLVRYANHPDLPAWRKWVSEAVAKSRRGGRVSLVVDKLRRRLSVYQNGRQVKTYRVDLGLGGMDRKLHAGDDATPEGIYKIREIRGPGQTQYYRAFLLNYPNRQDQRRFERARRKGEIPRNSHPGGLIEIHGKGGKNLDWTQGCVALTDQEMDELTRLVEVGTPVAIVGYDPRDEEDPW